MLLKDCTNMRVRCVNSQRNGCSRKRVSKDGYRGKEKLGSGEGGFQHRGPLERFPRPLRALVRGARTQVVLWRNGQ